MSDDPPTLEELQAEADRVTKLYDDLEEIGRDFGDE